MTGWNNFGSYNKQIQKHMPSWELTYPLPRHFRVDFPFPKVWYLSLREGKSPTHTTEPVFIIGNFSDQELLYKVPSSREPNPSCGWTRNSSHINCGRWLCNFPQRCFETQKKGQLEHTNKAAVVNMMLHLLDDPWCNSYLKRIDFIDDSVQAEEWLVMYMFCACGYHENINALLKLECASIYLPRWHYIQRVLITFKSSQLLSYQLVTWPNLIVHHKWPEF